MFKRIRLIAIIGLIAASLALVIFAKSRYTVPVAMYHSVTPDADPGSRLQVSVKSFQRQMDFLKTHHYNVVPLEDIARLIRDKLKVPPKTIAITFDDGSIDNYVYAYPILKKLGFPATIFVIINEVGRPGGDKLSWGQIKEMQLSGLINFGSHTLDHPYLVDLKSGVELKKQIFDSKIILEAKLGRPVDMFAYPAGRFNPRIRQLVIDAGYKFAFATNLGSRFPDNDIFAIKRLRISSSSDNLFIFWFETSGYYNIFRKHNHR